MKIISLYLIVSLLKPSKLINSSNEFPLHINQYCVKLTLLIYIDHCFYPTIISIFHRLNLNFNIIELSISVIFSCVPNLTGVLVCYLSLDPLDKNCWASLVSGSRNHMELQLISCPPAAACTLTLTKITDIDSASSPPQKKILKNLLIGHQILVLNLGTLCDV